MYLLCPLAIFFISYKKKNMLANLLLHHFM
jgi:hypothetical protein